MSCWAIIAIKSRARRKGRLRDALDESSRDELIRTMLDRVLNAARSARTVNRVLIVSPEHGGLPSGVPVLHDTGIGLDQAFELAREHARSAQVQDLVLLPADLPQVEAADVEALVEAGRRAGVAIAPDHTGTGTNGLFLPAGLDFTCHFGAGSRVRHETEARRHAIVPAVVERHGLATDVDTPADLRELIRAGSSAGIAARAEGRA